MAEQLYQCFNCNLRGTHSAILGHICPGSSSEKDGSSSSSIPECEPSQDHQSTSFKWNDKCTRLLLTLYSEKKKKFENPHLKKKIVWEEICCVLRQHGYMLVSSQVENKFKSLLQAYKRAKDHNRQSGNGPKFSPFYKEMDEMLSDSPDINPVSAASSISGFAPLSPVDLRDNSSDVDSPTPRRGATKRKADGEPSWFTQYRKQTQINHDERMQLQRENHQERMQVQRELIDVMKDLINKRN